MAEETRQERAIRLFQEAYQHQMKKELDEATKVVQLSDVDRELIIRWLLQDNRVVFGGEPIAPPVK